MKSIARTAGPSARWLDVIISTEGRLGGGDPEPGWLYTREQGRATAVSYFFIGWILRAC